MPQTPSLAFWNDAIAIIGVMVLCGMVPGSAVMDQGGGLVTPPSTYDAERVTPAQAQERIAKGEDLLFVDVRPKESYDVAHVKGAISSPWKDLPTGHAMLPKERLLLLYCT